MTDNSVAWPVAASPNPLSHGESAAQDAVELDANGVAIKIGDPSKMADESVDKAAANAGDKTAAKASTAAGDAKNGAKKEML